MLLFTLQNETLSWPLQLRAYTTTPKGTKYTKNRNLLVHIVESSTVLVKVDIKVINASLTQNQCLQ